MDETRGSRSLLIALAMSAGDIRKRVDWVLRSG